MNVWVVSGDNEGDGEKVLKIFFAKEKAEEFKDILQKNFKEWHQLDSGWHDNLTNFLKGCKKDGKTTEETSKAYSEYVERFPEPQVLEMCGYCYVQEHEVT